MRKPSSETRFWTVRDGRADKVLATAEADQRARDDRAEAERIEGLLRRHPQIGRLNSGKFYAFVDGRGEVCSRRIERVIEALGEAQA